jgi:hypothetical protein
MARKDIELRDHYAGIAMQVILSKGLKRGNLDEDFMADVVSDAFKVAQFMMTQREYEDMDCD